MTKNDEINNKGDHRFSAWVSLLALSVFCLASNVNVAEAERIFFTELQQQEPDPKTPARKFVTAVTSISTAVSFISLLAHFLFKDKFVGTKAEMAAVVLLIALWAAGLPVVMNPNNEIAQAGLFIIDYSLYFFSWLAFDTTLLIFGSLQKTSHKVQLWSGLALCSVIVVGASTRLYRDSTCTGARFEVDCERIKRAIGLGASCAAISLVVTFFVSRENIGMWLETGERRHDFVCIGSWIHYLRKWSGGIDIGESILLYMGWLSRRPDPLQ